MKFLLSYLIAILLFISCNKKAEQRTSNNEVKGIALCGNSILSSTDLLRNLPIAKIHGGVGNSHLKITTLNEKAQQLFDYGINLLHDFNHIEAYRAFNAVILADSNCAMGYWGLAMCQPGFGFDDNQEWNKAITKANILKINTSPEERILIEASKILVEEGLDRASIAFKAAVDKFPENAEILAFTAIVLRQNVKTDEDSNACKAMLEAGMAKFPNHVGLLHYYVHVMELRPDFLKAKLVAEKMAKIAQNAAHIQHMQGHIYFLEGKYSKATHVFEQADKQENQYHKTEKIPYGASQNYMHNLHYMTVAYSELGEKQKALDASLRFSKITIKNFNSKGGSALMLFYKGKILPALVHIRFREFKKAEEIIGLSLNNFESPISNDLVKNYLKVMQGYCKGMDAVLHNNFNEAVAQGQTLTELMHSFQQQGATYNQSPEFKSINETFDIMNMAQFELAGWIDNMDNTKPFNDIAWQEALKLESAIKYDEPPRLMYPVAESLARLHQQRGEKLMAKKAIQMALLRRPKSTIILKLLTNT